MSTTPAAPWQKKAYKGLDLFLSHFGSRTFAHTGPAADVPA